MEESRFDTLPRKAAKQATRREMVGALIASAIVFNARGESDATKKAEKRKQRKRRERKQPYPLSFAKDQVRGVNIAGKIFRIERKPDDSEFIRFFLHVPPDA